MNTSEQTDKRILIVDTEHCALSGLYHLLRRDGVSVTACESIEEAVSVVEKRAHDLVLIGGGPGRNNDGIKFGQHVRDRRPGTHVIVLTESSPATIRNAGNLDVYRFTMTPDGIENLYEKLRNSGVKIGERTRQKGHS